MVINHKNWVKKRIGEVVDPPKTSGHFQLFANKYWLVDNDNNIYFYKSFSSPQCNSNKVIVEGRIKEGSPFTGIKFIQYVFVPLDIGEYI